MRDEDERRRRSYAPAIPAPATAVDGALHVGGLFGWSRRTCALDRLCAVAIIVEHRLHSLSVVVEAIRTVS